MHYNYSCWSSSFFFSIYSSNSISASSFNSFFLPSKISISDLNLDSTSSFSFCICSAVKLTGTASDYDATYFSCSVLSCIYATSTFSSCLGSSIYSIFSFSITVTSESWAGISSIYSSLVTSIYFYSLDFSSTLSFPSSFCTSSTFKLVSSFLSGY